MEEIKKSSNTQSDKHNRMFPPFFRKQESRLFGFRSSLFQSRLMFERSKSKSLRNVSVTRICDTLSYGFLQIVHGISIGPVDIFVNL